MCYDDFRKLADFRGTLPHHSGETRTQVFFPPPALWPWGKFAESNQPETPVGSSSSGSFQAQTLIFRKLTTFLTELSLSCVDCLFASICAISPFTSVLLQTHPLNLFFPALFPPHLPSLPSPLSLYFCLQVADGLLIKPAKKKKIITELT